MKGAILYKGEDFYTDMRKLFRIIGNEQINYNWLITNCECYPNDPKIYELFSKKYIWISGKQLTEIIDKEDFQFIWGVFSGFSKDVTPEEVLKYDLPLIDDNEEFFGKNVDIHHPLADVEIVADDSSLTIFISKNDDLVQKFRDGFPLSEDLLEYLIK